MNIHIKNGKILNFNLFRLFKGGFFMENVFNIKYNTKLDRLEKTNNKAENKIWGFIKNHKFFSIILMSFFIFSCINFYLIYSFMKILENI